jgi:NitT/TauT family transport system substrate-binding protein
MERYALEGKINIVEMNPPDMPAALSAGSLDAYCVGEPFAAKALQRGDATRVHYVEEVWPDFICNLMIVKGTLIEQDPDLVRRLVAGAARAGLWARDHGEQAARIACQYWNQPLDLVQYALSTPAHRIRYDRFVPRVDEIQSLADWMRHFGLIAHNDVTGLVDDRFAREVDLSGIADWESILSPVMAASR